jgi:hypothetical protein
LSQDRSSPRRSGSGRLRGGRRADDVVASVIGIVTGMIARAQARGEAAPGDPRLYAFSLMGPMVMAMLFREVFGGVDADPPDLDALADQQ